MKSDPRPYKLLRALRATVLTGMGLGLVVAAIALAVWLVENPRRPEQAAPTQEIPAVEVQTAELRNEHVKIHAVGTVIPADEVTLRTEVSGKIVSLHAAFIEGGIVSEGDTLVEIDPRDYELAVRSAEAQVANAEADLTIEQGQQDIAQHEWTLFNKKEKASDLDRDLALRKPQQQQKEAALEAARVQLQEAKLELERTRIVAPFNAILRSADVRVGDLADSQTQLAQLARTDVYHVQVDVAADELQWIQIPRDEGDTGSTVHIETQSNGARDGTVLNVLADLEEDGLLARVLVRVEDPLDLQHPEERSVPLLLGDKVEVAIAGRQLEEVFVLPRAALQDGARIWIADQEDRLATLSPDIVWRGPETVLCRGFAPGTRIIVSALATPVEGMLLEVLKPTADEPTMAQSVPEAT